jgi:hypothetical protein
MVPLEKVLERHDPAPARRRPLSPEARARERRRSAPRPVERSATPLPAGRVRKRATREIGKVQVVDARAGLENRLKPSST